MKVINFYCYYDFGLEDAFLNIFQKRLFLPYLKFELADHSPLMIIKQGEVQRGPNASFLHRAATRRWFEFFLKLVFVSISASPGSLPGGAFFFLTADESRAVRARGRSSLPAEFFRLGDTPGTEVLQTNIVGLA